MPRPLTTTLLLAATLLLTACPFGPALPVEEAKPNYPPVISEEFTSPATRDVVILRNEGTPQRFSIDPFLDINENELLTVIWFSSDNLLSYDQVAPQIGAIPLYRGLFNLYNGSSFEIDPCAPEWRLADRVPLSVFVTDRQARFVDAPEPIGDDAFADSYTWFIRFEGECL